MELTVKCPRLQLHMYAFNNLHNIILYNMELKISSQVSKTNKNEQKKCPQIAFKCACIGINSLMIFLLFSCGCLSCIGKYGGFYLLSI